MNAYKKIKALGTEIEFYLQSDSVINFEKDFSELESAINIFEQQFSRFKDGSELSSLNLSTEKFKASPELIRILLLAKKFNQDTSGIFDPTILRTLENHGYDKSFDSPDFNSQTIIEIKKEKINFNEIIIDPENNLITRPEELKIDLGGIGKGYIVDQLVAGLKNKAYENFWISAGGDMFVSGVDEEGRTFKVGVQNPLQLEEDLFDLHITNQAVATSGIAKRQWQKNGHTVSHIIDPRTGESIENDLLAVTVISDKAVSADIYAKTVLILGKEAGLKFINNQENSEAIIIDKKGEVSLSANMNKYLIKK